MTCSGWTARLTTPRGTLRAFAARRLGLGACAITLAAAAVALAPIASAGATGPPDGRSYELVSNVDKGGQDAMVLLNSRLPLPSRDGRRLVWNTVAAYGGAKANIGNWYMAERGASGWRVASLTPPPPPGTPLSGEDVDANVPNIAGFGADLALPIFETTWSLDPRDDDGVSQDVYVRRPDGSFEWVSGPDDGDATPIHAFYGGASNDGSHVVFQTAEQLLPGDTHSTGHEVYESTGGRTRLVGVLPDGSVDACGASLGETTPTVLNGPSWAVRGTVSDDGSRIIFETPDVRPHEDSDPACSARTEIYQRVDGTSTIHVSASHRSSPDPSGPWDKMYMAASKDGTKILFATVEQLTDDDTDSGLDLYLYDGATGGLTRVTSGSSGHASSGFTRLTAMSGDGRRVYFIATGQLAPGASATKPNLYVWDGGTTRYVASGTDFAIADQDSWAPRQGSADSQLIATTTPNGDRLLFVGSKDLSGTGVWRLYEYDLHTGQTVCVSCPADGSEPVGGNTPVAVPHAFSNRLPAPTALTTDGRVFFDTADALVPEDTNHARDAYEYEDGHIYLISTGKDPYDVYIAGASVSGDDVFFSTYQRLTWQDHDDAGDLYDARVGGGIPEPQPVPSRACDGEGCHGAAATPASSQPSAWATEQSFGAGNATATPRFRVRAIRASELRRLARTGRLTLSVRSDAATTLTAVASWGRSHLAARGTATLRRAGTTTLTLRLRRSAVAQLQHTRTLRLRITVRSTAAMSSQTLAISVRRPAAARQTTHRARG
jgi:VCBS repeat-containing protein